MHPLFIYLFIFLQLLILHCKNTALQINLILKK